jgi:transglutaminase-like putative cysteine protease
MYAALTYEYGITGIRTTAAQALAAGRGVCQDSAHVMLAVCHLLGVPARYVSGHLLGQGGTHAWVEVLVVRGDAAVALPFDPCHGRRAGNGYLTVAVGRDYADVAPTSGTFVGAPGGRLTGTRHVGVIAVAA